MSTNRKDLGDPQLVRNIKGGDMRSFDVLFERYYPLICTFAFKMLRDREMADDITQDIFMKLWLYRSNLDPNQSVKSMLFTMTRNKCLDYFRSKREALKNLVPLVGEDLQDSTAADDSVDLHETGALLATSISRLPEQRKMIFEMSRYMHLSNKDIAKRLNISVRTVEKHIELALKDLRGTMS